MGMIYITTNKINNRKYIGVDTKGNPYYFGSGTAIRLAIKKYGTENFTKEIIEMSDDKEYLFEREKYWINYYNAVSSKDYYNISEGGKGGNMLISEESIRKHKEGTVKAIIINKEKRKGKTYEEIYGDRTEEEKEKRKLAGLGKKYSEERIKKSSDSHKGQIPWNKGLTKNDERVKKYIENRISKKYLKSYELITPLNEKILFNGKNELEDYFKEINKNLRLKSRITCDKLIKEKELKGYYLNII